MLALGLLASVSLLCALAASASALQLGLQFTGNYEQTENEMEAVGKSGADLFRVPLVPVNVSNKDWGFYNRVFTSAAVNGVTILPVVAGRIDGKGGLPEAGEKAAWSAWIAEAVQRYGYGGTFWTGEFAKEHPTVPARPVTAWEIWNEPNLEGIPATPFGEFLAWVGPQIQSVSNAQGNRGTEVLLGGLFAQGNKSQYQGALQYMEQVYKAPGASNGITGVAIHPYVLNSATFFESSYDAIDAFRFSVGGFWSVLNGLPGGTAKSLWITEFGLPAEGPEFAVGTANQAALLSEAFDYAKKNAATLRLQGVVWYNYRDAPVGGWAAFCGLRKTDGTFRASWFAFQEHAGAPRWPVSGPSVRLAYRDAGNANTVSGWQFGAESGWQQLFLWGHEVAAGTRPVVLRYEEGTHIFFADASRGNQITEWAWNPVTGWQQNLLETNPVAAGSSPSGVLVNGSPHIYFSDASTNRAITALVYNGKWTQTPFFGSPVAPNSSPSAIVHNGQPRVFFVNSANNNTITAWAGGTQVHFFGDPVAANSSPSAITTPGSAQVYFADAAKGNTIAVWTWGSTSIQQSFFFGDPVAANSSPSAIFTGGASQVYFADAAKGNTIAVWAWGSTLQQSFFFGDPVATNSSPAAVPNNGKPQVYFSDAATNGAVAFWEWGPTTIQQTRLFGHRVAAGSSPAL